MKSCDTNILLYYMNSACVEHKQAKRYLEARFLDKDFLICELVLVELYVLLRNPAVIASPLSAEAAVQAVQSFRNNPHWRVVDYPGGLMSEIWSLAQKKDFARRSIFDARLALTLLHHGVTELATRNVKDFRSFPFTAVIDPIAE